MENGLLTRDLQYQLQCINHIPANSHRYLGILPQKEVGRESTAEISAVVAHQPGDLSVQPTTRNNFKFKELVAPKEKITYELACPDVRGTTCTTAESLSRGAVVSSTYTRTRVRPRSQKLVS